jgi:hypothetical protein
MHGIDAAGAFQPAELSIDHGEGWGRIRHEGG